MFDGIHHIGLRFKRWIKGAVTLKLFIKDFGCINNVLAVPILFVFCPIATILGGGGGGGLRIGLGFLLRLVFGNSDKHACKH